MSVDTRHDISVTIAAHRIPREDVERHIEGTRFCENLAAFTKNDLQAYLEETA